MEKRIIAIIDVSEARKVMERYPDRLKAKELFEEMKDEIGRWAVSFLCKRNIYIKGNCIDSGIRTEISLLPNRIILSYGREKKNDLYDVYNALREISGLAFWIMKQGFFVRGGLSYGEVNHSRKECKGMGYDVADQLVKNEKQFVIALDPLFFNEESSKSVLWGRKSKEIERTRQYLEETYHAVDLFSIPVDGLRIEKVRKDPSLRHFLDVLFVGIDYDEDEARIIKTVIERELSREFLSEDDRERILWMKDYYNATVDSQGIKGVRIE